MDLSSELARPVEDLYFDLGHQIKSGLSASPPTKKNVILRGKRWFKTRLPYIADKICNDSMIVGLMANDKTKDRILLTAAILDLLSSLSLPVSPVTVTVLLVKEGIETICGSKSPSTDNT